MYVAISITFYHDFSKIKVADSGSVWNESRNGTCGRKNRFHNPGWHARSTKINMTWHWQSLSVI